MSRRHDLNQPYQSCQCNAHKAIRRKLRKRKAIGSPVAFRTDAVGSMRRVRALAAIGYSPRAIAHATGISQAEIGLIIAGRRKRVSVAHARAIAAVFEALSMRPAPPSRQATRARNRARDAGWYPPLAWDDPDDRSDRPKGVARAGRVTPARPGQAA